MEQSRSKKETDNRRRQASRKPLAGHRLGGIALYEFKKRPLTSYEDMIRKGYAYPGTTLEERLGDGTCPECGSHEWALAPIVLGSNEGGKCYIQRIQCGSYAHF
jgi:hypothetical protein